MNAGSSTSSNLELTAEHDEIPSCIEIGLRASKKGNFEVARQMLRTAIEQFEGHEAELPQLIELITNIADMYLNGGTYASAKEWYAKALHHSELLYGGNSLNVACLTARLAEVSALESNIEDFHKFFQRAQRVYLNLEESKLSALLGVLIDLSWVLCMQGRVVEVKPVNEMIEQIKRMEEEDRLGILVA